MARFAESVEVKCTLKAGLTIGFERTKAEFA